MSYIQIIDDVYPSSISKYYIYNKKEYYYSLIRWYLSLTFSITIIT